jgi:hypothetical protein
LSTMTRRALGSSSSILWRIMIMITSSVSLIVKRRVGWVLLEVSHRKLNLITSPALQLRARLFSENIFFPF